MDDNRKVAAIEKWNDLHTFRQDAFVQLLHLGMDPIQRAVRLRAFLQQHNSLDHIVVVDDRAIFSPHGFANLPEARSGRWGQGLTKAKMADCRWLKPVLVGQFEFVEWTPDHHLRHARFIAVREEKDVWDVRRDS